MIGEAMAALIADLEEEARKHRYTADILEARIQGLKEARQFLPIPPLIGNGAAPPRKTRRNIHKLVRELHRAEPDLDDETLAKRIGCRAAQVRYYVRLDE